MGPSQYDNVAPMIIAVAVMVGLVLLCRWVFSTTEKDRVLARRKVAAQTRGDYGLLVPVAAARTDDEARALRERLREAGIRGTVAPGSVPGELTVMVFRDDADRARTLVS